MTVGDSVADARIHQNRALMGAAAAHDIATEFRAALGERQGLVSGLDAATIAQERGGSGLDDQAGGDALAPLAARRVECPGPRLRIASASWRSMRFSSLNSSSYVARLARKLRAELVVTEIMRRRLCQTRATPAVRNSVIPPTKKCQT